VSLRRLRYQLRCAAKGHDTRPYLVGGSVIEHRCLRCGALVGEVEQAASSGDGPALPVSENPPPPAEPSASPVTSNGDSATHVDEPSGGDADADADPSTNTALAALRELGELHASGVLTDREFAAKKAELLRRV
jgi:Short C-terminal domain